MDVAVSFDCSNRQWTFHSFQNSLKSEPFEISKENTKTSFVPHT